MEREETMLPINWFWPIFFFTGSILLFLLNQLDGGQNGLSTREASVAFAPVGAFIAGCFSLKAYSVSTTGITTKWAAYPRRTVLWESVKEAKTVPDSKSFCILLIEEGCPVPDINKGESYDYGYARYHMDHIVMIENAGKVLPIVEQYYPGEIKGKELLLNKK